MHEQEAAAHGWSCRYALIDLDTIPGGVATLPSLVDAAERDGFAGLNITHPCKESVLPLLDTVSDHARKIGAVNTIVFTGSARVGWNTDWWGFRESASHGLEGAPFARVVQLGAGGAGAATAYASVKRPTSPPRSKQSPSGFPAEERALATGLFNSGVALGTIVASIGVPLTAAAFGWRATFVVTGLLGLFWVPLWWISYRSHNQAESAASPAAHPAISWRSLIGLRQTWAYALTKSLGDPVWWFYLFWLPKYLAAQFHVRGTEVIPYLTAVYVCADIGCLAAGWLSSALLNRGWSLNAARKGTMGLLVAVMTPAVIVAGTLHDPRVAIALIAIACGAHQAWSTMVFTVAIDLFPSSAVGSVSGFGGFVAGIVSIGVAEAVGRVLDRDATFYLPIFIGAGLLYPLALGVFQLLSPKMQRANIPS